MTSQLLSCWHLKSYRERLGMNGMISVYLRLHDGSITNQQWYFSIVNITRGWIHVPDDRFSKFRNRKNLRSFEPFGKWRHDLLARATHTANNVLDDMIFAKRLTCNGISLDSWHCENIKKWCYWTWGNNQYRNLQAGVNFEPIRFCVARDQRHYRKCAVGVGTMHGFGTDLVRNPAIWLVESRN